MKLLKPLFATTVRATGVDVLDEGFDNVAGLAGWAQVNHSVPAGSA